jgi:transposase
VKHEAGHWSAVFSWEVEGSESLERLESESGIDLGITHFAALSNGTFIESPRQYRKAEEAGRQVYKINAQHTSQICSACGKKGPKKDLTEL